MGLSLASKIPSQKARWRLGRSQKGLRGDRREARGISGDLGEVGEELEGLGEDWKVFEGRKDFAAEVVLERVGGQTPRKSGERKKNLKEPRAIIKRPQESDQWKDSQSNFFLFSFLSYSFSLSSSPLLLFSFFFSFESMDRRSPPPPPPFSPFFFTKRRKFTQAPVPPSFSHSLLSSLVNGIYPICHSPPAHQGPPQSSPTVFRGKVPSTE